MAETSHPLPWVFIWGNGYVRADPGSVTIAGSLQSELGCAGATETRIAASSELAQFHLRSEHTSVSCSRTRRLRIRLAQPTDPVAHPGVMRRTWIG
jgi:hypothetical protein